MKKYIFMTICLITSISHAMDKPDKPTAEQKEQELFARMAAMRLEQARREQPATPSQPTPPSYEYQPHEYRDGIPQEYHWRPTEAHDEQPKETTKKDSKKLNMFATDFVTPAIIQRNKAAGYLVHHAPDGLTCFYRPGTEGLIGWFLSNFRRQRQEMQNDSSNE